jgi:outer membrane protein assembly factor BamB
MPSRRDALRLGGAAAVAGLAGCTAPSFDPAFGAAAPADGEWLSTRRGPRNAACSPTTALPETPPSVAWRSKPNRPVLELLVDADAVYVTHPVSTAALDVATGESLWTTAGEEQAMVPGGRRVAALGDGVVYTAGSERLNAFDATDGSTKWSTDARPHTVDGLRNYGLQVAGDAVVLGFHGGLAAFDAADGSHRWTVHPGGTGYVYPAVAHGRLYVGSPGPLYAYRPAAGLDALLRDDPETLWQGHGPVFCTWPAVAGDRIVVGDQNRGMDGDMATTLYAYERGGGLDWRVSVPGAGRAPAVSTESDLAVTAGGENPSTLLAVELDSADGEVRWRREVSPFVNDPVLAGDLVLAAVGASHASGRSGLLALDLRTGAERWWRPVEGGVSRLAAVGDRIYAATSAGRVLALE